MNRQGQSIIEYSLIAVLVVLGIVTMGPYVLRSVGAHFKIWDDGIKDSFEENLSQAPINDIPVINTPCNCKTTDDGCGSAKAGTQCEDPTKHGYTITCVPIGCNHDPYSWCVLDSGSPGHPGCCTIETNDGCGNVPLPVDGSGKVNTSLEIPLPNPANPPPANPANNNCYFGDEIQHAQCGSNTAYQCVDGTSFGCLLPACQGNPPTGSLFCATNTNQPPTGLNNNYPIGNPVANQPSCPQNPTCQVYCDTASGYSITANGAGCAKQCTAASLPTSVIISSDANPSPMTTPPSGMNYYFFNFNTAGNGIYTQTVAPYSGAIIPGQTYHLKMVSGASRDGYGSQFNDNHCDSNNICDSDIVENDAGLLHIVVGDQQPGGQSNYDWQILDAKNNPVFEWSGSIDYSLDVAFTGCAETAPKCVDNSGNAFSGHWTGRYDFNQHTGTNGDFELTVDCANSSSVGTCIDGPPYPTSYVNGGANLSGYSCPGTCQAVTFYGQSGSNTTSFSYSIECASGTQIKDIIDNDPNVINQNVTPAAINGCNWNGVIDVMTLESGNDMYWTCGTDSNGKGILTQFQYK